MKAITRLGHIGAFLIMLALPATVHAQDFTYESNKDGTLTITGYRGSKGPVTIPSKISGLAVTGIENSAFRYSSLTSVTIPDGVASIGQKAFAFCTRLTRVAMPSSITNIGNLAFAHCTRLAEVRFKGDAPGLGSDVFKLDDKATIYCLPNTTGWGKEFDGRPTAVWSQQATTNGATR